MPGAILKLADADTGESHLDVVRVPEGFSLQMGMNGGVSMPEDFISVIVSPEDALDMIVFLAETPSPPNAPAATDYGCPNCDADTVLADATDRFGICASCGWFGLIADDIEDDDR